MTDSHLTLALPAPPMLPPSLYPYDKILIGIEGNRLIITLSSRHGELRVEKKIPPVAALFIALGLAKIAEAESKEKTESESRPKEE